MMNYPPNTVVLDSSGEPVYIKDGRILCAEPPGIIYCDDIGRWVDTDEGTEDYDVDDVWWDSEEREWKISVYRHEPSDAKSFSWFNSIY